MGPVISIFPFFKTIQTFGIGVSIWLGQSFPTLVDAFLPLLILEHFIPPLWNVHSSPVQVPTINYNRNNGLY